MTARPPLPRAIPGVERRRAARYAVMALLLGLAAGGAMADRTDTTTQMDRPLLAYRCPAGFDTAEALCHAFREMLGRSAPRHALRRIAPDDAVPPLRDHDLFIALHARLATPYRLTGRLDWQTGDGGARVEGPDVSLDSSDAAVSPGMYDDFLRALWEVSAPPALAGPDRGE